MSAKISLSLVEDDPATLDIWKRQLTKAGFQCVGAFADAEMALPELLARPPEIILADWKLPGMDGLELIERCKAAHPHVQAVLITNHDLDELPLTALAAGVEGFILKPCETSVIALRLREVLSGQSVYTHKVVQRLADVLRAGQLLSATADLAPHEFRVLERLTTGASAKQVAQQLGLSEASVTTYRKRAYQKLKVHTLVEAMRKMNERV